jgi:hypothetical protein
MTHTRTLLTLFLLFILTSCSMIPTQPQSAKSTSSGPTFTPCPCSETGVPTPTGGIKLAGPSGPSPATQAPAAETTVSPGGETWATYANPDYGFSFQYPEVYTGKDYGFCAARASANLPPGAIFQLALGSRTMLTLKKTDQGLEDAVAAFRADPSSKDFTFDEVKQRTVGGETAVVLPYHSGGTNRYAEAVFFVHNGILYRVDTGVPSACDIPSLNLRELDAYSHLLDSFAFSK